MLIYQFAYRRIAEMIEKVLGRKFLKQSDRLFFLNEKSTLALRELFSNLAQLPTCARHLGKIRLVEKLIEMLVHMLQPLHESFVYPLRGSLLRGESKLTQCPLGKNFILYDNFFNHSGFARDLFHLSRQILQYLRLGSQYL